MKDLFNDKETNKSEVLIQNYLTTSAPAFAVKPHWYVNGNEKKVKVGKESFNYIDYLEAYCNIDCGTYRSYDALENIYRKIEAAYKTVEEYNKKEHNLA